MSISIESLGIDRLTVGQRLELIEQIWDSLPQQVNPDEVPDWHLAEIAKRRAEADANPGVGTPWREALAQARKALMSLPVILRPEADADLQATFDELERLRAGLGNRFLARVAETLERIETMPEMYGVVWQDVPAARLRKFRHLVYYVVFPNRVKVLAVLHGTRDESTWRSRA